MMIMENEQNFNQHDELLVKYLTGNADMAEREDALNWISHNKENRDYFNELRSIYEVAKTVQVDHAFKSETSLNKIKAQHYKHVAVSLQKSDSENKRLFRLELLKYAALIIFIISLGIVGYNYVHDMPNLASKEIWNTIEAPFGSRTRLTLADGTIVWLNAGSQLRYSSKFAQQNRKVYLDGEAYFNVARDENKQFVVSTTYLDIKVFGTQFNVKAYLDENVIQTTLVEGSVSIEEKGLSRVTHRKVVLKPNETATYYILKEESNTSEKRSRKC